MRDMDVAVELCTVGTCYSAFYLWRPYLRAIRPADFLGSIADQP